MNPLARVMLAIVAAISLFVVASLPHVGLSIAWTTVLPFAAGTSAMAAFLVYLWCVPGNPGERHVPETVTAFLIVLLFAQVLMPAQYLAVALRRPLADRYLAAADAAFGVHVSRYAAWTMAHPTVDRILAIGYYSFVPQLAILAPALGLLLRDREALWEYVFLFGACSTLAVMSVAIFPAHSFQYFHYQPSLDMSRPAAHFMGLRSGSFRVIRFNDMDGLVAMPSLHAAGGAMAIWAVRRHRAILACSCVLNLTLIAATFLTGVHYLVDAVAGVAMVAALAWTWKACVFRLADVRRPSAVPVHLGTA